MMTTHEKKDTNQAAIRINRPAPRVVLLLAALFSLANMLHCASQHTPLSERLLSSDNLTKQSAFKEMDGLDMMSRKKYLGIMINMLHDKNPDNRVLAAEALGHMGPTAEEAVPDIVQVLHEENDPLRSSVIKALAEINTGAVPTLIAALNHQDPAIRCGAADALGSMGPGAKEAVPALANLLSDGDYAISRHAASALGQIGPTAVPALTQVARGGDRHATEMAETAFSHLKADPKVVHELAQLLGNANENPGVRAFAIKALGKMQKDARTAVPDLARALGDENNDVRSAAGWALGQIGPAAIPYLREALKNDNPQVRSGAAYALGYMGPVAEDAVPALLQTMKDEDQVVRIDAILALDKMQASSRAVVKALIRVLDEDNDDFVRLSAARVLNKIGTSEAKEAVITYNKKNNR